MFISFILIPWLCAIVTATAAAPLGALLGWRRLIYFGEAMAHASLLGIAIALSLDWPMYIGIWLISFVLVGLLFWLKQHSHDEANNILGTLSHFALALGMIILSSLENIRTDLMGYLFGDILTASSQQLWLIILISVLALLVLKTLWQPLILMTLHPIIAKTELKYAKWYDLIYLLLLAIFIGVMVQIFGLLLVIALLILPANTANKFAKTPEQSVLFAIAIAMIATTAGIGLAWSMDLPVSPAIVVMAGVEYFVAVIVQLIRNNKDY